MNNSLNRLIVIFILVVALTSCDKEKARILIIGDSISIGYTPYVQEYLRDEADIYHNPGNAQHSGTGIDSIVNWIGDSEWNIIQFNWGLWDLCYRHPDSKVQGNRDKVNGRITYHIDDYRNNLDAIVKLIRKNSDADLVFVSTTFVPDDEAGRFKEDAIKYNKIAMRVMQDNEVTINDIYEESMLIHGKYGKGTDDVHYLQEGYRELGLQISNFLKQKIRQLSD